MIEIRARNRIRSLVFLDDGRHILSADDEGVIRRWRCDDGREIGEGIKTQSGLITAIALSDDGNWIVSSGWQAVNVLNRKSQSSFAVSEHKDWVDTVHISPDSTKFATGANDKRAFIWEISTGKQLVGPLEHDDRVRTVRFSPAGDRIATSSKGLRIYNANNGDLLNTIPSSLVSYASSNLIAWSGVQNVFALTSPNTIAHIHVNAKQILSNMTIPGDLGSNFGYIALSSNSRFIASFVGRSISLWDASTYTQIGSTIHRSALIWSIALSLDNNYLATSDANGTITLHDLNHILPSYYLVDQSVVRESLAVNKADHQPQTEVLRDGPRARESCFDQSITTTMLIDDRLRPRILGGSYRIKSNIDDLYLTCPQRAHGTVVVQKLDLASALQTWNLSLVADGSYSIATRRGCLAVSLSVGNTNVLNCDPDGGYTTWTIERRGDAYVIGNATDAMAIRRMQDHSVSVSLRDNTINQRWVLERVAN